MSRPARARERHPALHSRWWMLGHLLMGAAIVAYTVGWLRGEDTSRGVVVIPFLLVLSFGVLDRISRLEPRFDLAGMTYAALGAKLCAVYARYWMVNSYYDGVGDSSEYHLFGTLAANRYRTLDFGLDPDRPIPGTGFLRVLTGVVYAITGTDQFSGFIIFGLLSLAGCWLFARAFAAALPEADTRRYTMLVLFWPSLLFWPASIGKEAWMVFALGLTSLGVATMLRNRGAHGLAMTATGLLAATMPRPHVAMLALTAVATGVIMAALFGARAGGERVGIITKISAATLLLLGAVWLAPAVTSFLNIDDFQGEALTGSLTDIQRRTTQGGSAFTPTEPDSIVDYPWAVVTVLLRPLPHEAGNAQTTLAATEGLALIGLLAWSFPSLRRLPVAIMRNAYVAYAAGFVFMFCYVFSAIGNFGILTRQRVQVLPLLFVLAALRPREAPDAATSDAPGHLHHTVEPTARPAAARITIAPRR